VVTLVARQGRVIHFGAIGKKLASGTPLEKDMIFRINSITKLLTAATMMIFYEEAKWNPKPST
jgi:CubicO group peptidase (beta-lactamase class C family)